MKKFLSLLTLGLLCQSLWAAPDFYLRGHDGNWDARDAYKFSQSGSIYTLHVDELTSDNGFKIATSDWRPQFGSSADFVFDQPMTCVEGDGNNIELSSGTKVAGATLRFDYTNTSAPTLTVIPDLYLAGEINNWNNTTSAYRFNRSTDGLYTLSLGSLTGKFRIAAGISPDWTIEYGGPSSVPFNTPVSLIAGPGNNMALEGSPTNIKLTFNKESRTLQVSDAEEDVKDADFYLAGEINNWASNDAAYKFSKDGDEYVLELNKLSGDFKIVTADWSLQYGCPTAIDFGETYSVVLASSGSNMKLAEGHGSNLTIRFNPSAHTVVVKGMPTLYLIGDFNNWGISPIYAFSYADGVYTLSTHDFSGEFKISNYDYSLQFGTDSEKPFGMNNNYAIGQTGDYDGNISFAGSGANAAKSRIKLTLMANGTPGATTSTALITEAEAPVEYFNLQGMRVKHPANGIFIRRCGSKVDKIAIK